MSRKPKEPEPVVFYCIFNGTMYRATDDGIDIVAPSDPDYALHWKTATRPDPEWEKDRAIGDQILAECEAWLEMRPYSYLPGAYETKH